MERKTAPTSRPLITSSTRNIGIKSKDELRNNPVVLDNRRQIILPTFVLPDSVEGVCRLAGNLRDLP